MDYSASFYRRCRKVRNILSLFRPNSFCFVDGIFDSRAFSGRERSSKVKVKVEDVKLEPGEPALPIASTSTANAVRDDSVVDVKMETPDDTPAASLPITRTSSRVSKRDPAKEAIVEKRLELLNSGPESRTLVVKRYYALMLPALINVYSASVNANTRAKAVLGLTKIVNFGDSDSLASILKVRSLLIVGEATLTYLRLQGVPISSFLAAVLSSPDQAPLFTSALQLVELFLIKLPDDYAYFFRREGVMHEIERIAAEPILTPPKSKRSSPSRTPKVSADGTASAAGPSGLAQALSNHSADVVASTSTSPAVPALTPAEALAKDMVTRRAQHIRDTYIMVDSEPMLKAKSALEAVELLVTRLDAVTSGTVTVDGDVVELVKEVALLFSNELSPLSSFELSRSGLVEGLLRFTTLPNPDRR